MEKHLLPWWNLIYGNQCTDEFPPNFLCTTTTCDAYGLSDGQIMPWCNQVSRHLHTSPWSCLGIVQCGKCTVLSVIVSIIFCMRSQYPRSSLCKEKTSLLLYTRSMKFLCWSHVKLASFPMLSWKGNQSISFLQSKSVELVPSLGPNSGFSISGLVGWMGSASTWQLLVLISWGGTGWNLIVMLSPSCWPIFYFSAFCII